MLFLVRRAAALHEAAEQRAKQIDCQTVHDGAAVVCKVTPTALNADGYQLVSVGMLDFSDGMGKKQRNVYLHHLMLWAAKGDFPEEGFHVSHLCHHPDCSNPDHLVKEPEWLNILRKRCPGGKACACPRVAEVLGIAAPACLLPSL